jgi:5-methylcytosine-specific restriction endonuclease McrA
VSCGCRLILNTPLLPRSAELDHIKPKAHRGKDDEENYQLLCRCCNGKKSDKEPDVFKKLYNAEPGTLKIRL